MATAVRGARALLGGGVGRDDPAPRTTPEGAPVMIRWWRVALFACVALAVASGVECNSSTPESAASDDSTGSKTTGTGAGGKAAEGGAGGAETVAISVNAVAPA